MGKIDLKIFHGVFDFGWVYGRRDLGSDSATDTLTTERATSAWVDGGVMVGASQNGVEERNLLVVDIGVIGEAQGIGPTNIVVLFCIV